MSPSEQTDERTRAEWRELGFYYDVDSESSTWRFVGSADGIANFSKLLRAYVADERNARISEHDHFGPYWYLKIATWHEPQISADGISGTLPDLNRLAVLIDEGVRTTRPGESFEISRAYAPDTGAKLIFEVRTPGFDPSMADPLLAGGPPN